MTSLDLGVQQQTRALLSQHPKTHTFFGSIFRNEHNQHVIDIHPEINKTVIGMHEQHLRNSISATPG